MVGQDTTICYDFLVKSATSTQTEHFCIDKLDSILYNNLPYRAVMNGDLFRYIARKDSTQYQGRLQTGIEDIAFFLSGLADTCYQSPSEGYPDIRLYTVGLGLTYTFGGSSGTPVIWYDKLIYYKKGTTTWGTLPNISDIQKSTPISPISIYPNPSYNNLIINYIKANSNELYTFSVIDITGRELVPQTALYNSTTYEIAITDWAQGLYIVRVQDEKGNIYTEKFIKE